jgi:hypothetical protein
VPGASAIATNGERVVHRAPLGSGGEALLEDDRVLYAVESGTQIGRPSMSGSLVAFHVASRRASRIMLLDLRTGTVRSVRRDPAGQLLNPTLDGNRLLYVRASYDRQRVKIGPRRPRRVSADRTLWATWPTVHADAGLEPGRRDHARHYRGRRPDRYPRPPKGVTDTLWTTALGPSRAYVTRLRSRNNGTPSASVLELPLPRRWRAR